MTRLAIFDLDGTITATSEIDGRCFVAAFEESFGFTPDTDWSSYRDFSDEGIVLEACRSRFGAIPTESDLSAVKVRFVQKLEAALAESPQHFALVPGATELLAYLAAAGWHLRIATGSWRSSAELKLAAAGLQDVVPLFACDGRPAREAIVIAAIDSIAGTASSPIQRTVAVGDGVWDVKTAARLGLPFVGVGKGDQAERLRRAGARIVLSDFADLERSVFSLETASLPMLDDLTT